MSEALRESADARQRVDGARGAATEDARTEGTGPYGTGHPRGRATWRARIRRAAVALARPGPWRRGPVSAALTLLLGLVMLAHRGIPDVGGLSSLVETFLPWLGLLVPVLLARGLWRRSASTMVALLLPAYAWTSLFGGLLADKSRPGGDLTVVSHNVGADNHDPAGTARDLAASGADLLALQEMTARGAATYERELAGTYLYHEVRGTVGLWSKLPLSDTRPVDVLRGDVGSLARTRAAAIPPDAPRALRATVTTDHGPLAVYVAHLGSVRVMPRGGFWTDSRDAGVVKLAEAVADEKLARVVVLGDMNGTTDDRVFTGLTSRVRAVQEEAGDGFGFTWPTAFPLARIDQIFVRGVQPASSWVLPPTGSDHLPVAASLDW